MQCLGLTTDYHRCPRQAADEQGYCGDHRREELVLRGERVIENDRNPLVGITNRLFRRSIVPRVPDEVRYHVPKALESSPTPIVVERLLQDPDSTIRWCAAFVLRRRRDPVAIEPLWHVLLHDSSRLTRQQAAVALGKIGVPSVLAPLLECLWHDADPGVRQAAAIAIGNLGYVSAARDIGHALEREQNSVVRWDLILALGQLGDRSAEPLIREIERAERADFIQTACRQALENIRRRQALL